MTQSHMEPDRVRSGAARFDTAAHEVEVIAQKLEHALSATGDCWGHDESGQAFAKDYVPGAKGISEALSTVREGLHNLREQVEGAANDFDKIDQQHASEISKLES